MAIRPVFSGLCGSHSMQQSGRRARRQFQIVLKIQHIVEHQHCTRRKRIHIAGRKRIDTAVDNYSTILMAHLEHHDPGLGGPVAIPISRRQKTLKEVAHALEEMRDRCIASTGPCGGGSLLVRAVGGP